MFIKPIEKRSIKNQDFPRSLNGKSGRYEGRYVELSMFAMNNLSERP